MSALLLSGALTFVSAQAATTATTVSAHVISPAEVSILAAEGLLRSANTGVLTLSIPGAGATGSGEEAFVKMTLTSTGVHGTTIVFSTTDSAPLASLVLALAASGGSFGMNGILSTGQVVNLFITHAEQNNNGTGRVYAIVAYN